MRVRVHDHTRDGGAFLSAELSAPGEAANNPPLPLPEARGGQPRKKKRKDVHVYVDGGGAPTRDAGQFDESKHKRDGGKFSATQGASKSNAEHSERAAPHAAEVRKNGPDSEKGKLHNEALSAWAEARKHLDPDKPLAEQSEAYKAAVKKAEEATQKARAGSEKPKPDPKGKDPDKKDPKGKPGGPQKAAGASPQGLTAAEALRALRKARRSVDPDEHEHDI